jgi:hypothetical protein
MQVFAKQQLDLLTGQAWLYGDRRREQQVSPDNITHHASHIACEINLPILTSVADSNVHASGRLLT